MTAGEPELSGEGKVEGKVLEASEMPVSTAPTCSERVNRGDARWSKFEPCGRPVKEDGLCGLHLGARNRRAEKAKKGREERERGVRIRDEAEALGAALGITVTAHYRGGQGYYDGNFVVPGDWLRALTQATLSPPKTGPS